MRSSVILLPLLLLPLLTLAQGQQGSGSPYSAYGFGDLLGNTQVARRSMGGLGIAYNDPFGVDPSNPASYSSLVRPVFEAGVAVRNAKVDGEAISGTGRRTDLLGLSLGVPFGHGRWGVALGLAPYSRVGYRISTTAPLASGEGDVAYTYTGTGGLNRVYGGVSKAFDGRRDSLGNGHRLAIGVNYTHLFGSLVETRQAVYPTDGYYHSNAQRSVYIHDGVLSLGAQFQGMLARHRSREVRGWRYTVAASMELPADLTAERTEVVNSFVYSAIGTEIAFDTALYVLDETGSIGLPAAVGVGLALQNDHWAFSAEHRSRTWSLLEENGVRRNDLADLSQLAFGASYRPAGDIGGSFWERTIYRAGIRYLNDYLVVDGQQLSQIGMSFGMSLPVMGSSTRSRLNFGMELGERGERSNGLLRERYADLFVGIAITPDLREQWFKKRRIE